MLFFMKTRTVKIMNYFFDETFNLFIIIFIYLAVTTGRISSYIDKNTAVKVLFIFHSSLHIFIY
jgi:hypothetical protein